MKVGNATYDISTPNDALVYSVFSGSVFDVSESIDEWGETSSDWGYSDEAPQSLICYVECIDTLMMKVPNYEAKKTFGSAYMQSISDAMELYETDMGDGAVGGDFSGEISSLYVPYNMDYLNVRANTTTNIPVVAFFYDEAFNWYVGFVSYLSY